MRMEEGGGWRKKEEAKSLHSCLPAADPPICWHTHCLPLRSVAAAAAAAASALSPAWIGGERERERASAQQLAKDKVK